MNYGVEHIVTLSDIETVRKNPGMFIGSVETTTRLLEECIDNSLDEVQTNKCDIIGVFINTKTGVFEVLDNGRGFPFNQKLPVEKDPPVMSCIKLFSSGKFKKGDDDSAYKIAAGLHGVGLTAVNALSEYMEIEIFRDNKHATYRFDNGEEITRKVESFTDKVPFSTKIKYEPKKEYFNDFNVDLQIIEERLRISCANYPKLKIVFKVDGESHVIKGTEDELILDYLSTTVDSWHEFKNTKKFESCYLKLGWDNEPPTSQKWLTCVNLIRVHSGSHVNKLSNILKDVFISLGKKYNYQFKPEDVLIGLRVYMNLKIIKTSFEAQVKVRLESKTDLTIMQPIEQQLRKYFESNPIVRDTLLEKFQTYRRSIQSKKISSTPSTKKRASSKFTKLRDCSGMNGELLIGEGDSAVGGLIDERDSKKHAILPLRGVIPNSLTKKDLLENNEIKEIISAIGCGIENHCDMSKLRYTKIILAADADPAGHFITSLLILLFAKLVPDIIKQNKLFVCKTPLYGYGEHANFKPLWTEAEVEKARASGKHIRRLKGLGELNTDELRIFTLDEKTRILIPVKWSDKYQKIFKLMSDSTEKRKLVMGTWDIDEKEGTVLDIVEEGE